MNLDDRATAAGAAARDVASRSDAVVRSIARRAQRRQQRRVAGVALTIVVVAGLAGMQWYSARPDVMLGPGPSSGENAERKCPRKVSRPKAPTRSGWQQLSAPPLKGADDQSAVAVGAGHVVVVTFGPSQTAVLDVAAKTWSCFPGPDLPEAVVRFGEPAGLIGGDEAAFVWDGQHVSQFDLRTATWNRLADPPSAAARGEALMAAMAGPELMVWWAPDPDTAGVPGAAWDLAAHRWRPLPNVPLTIDDASRPVWSGEELFFVGAHIGGRTEPAERSPLVAIYDPARNQWRRAASPSLSPGAFTAEWVSGRLVVWDYELAGARYDASADRWDPLEPPPFKFGECGPASVAIGRTMFMNYCGQFGRWNSVNDTWTKLAVPTNSGGLLLVGDVLVTTAARTINYGGRATWLYQLPDAAPRVTEAPPLGSIQRLDVTCTPDGPVVDESAQVEATSAGVQVRFIHPRRWTIGWADAGGGANPRGGVSDVTWPIPPGRGMVSCLPYDGDAGDKKWEAHFNVLDPHGYWKEHPLRCGFVSSGSVSSVEGGGAEVRRKDAATAAVEAFGGGKGITAVPNGYPDAAEPEFAILQDGKPVGLVETLEGGSPDTVSIDGVTRCG